jgi:prevent-host-death family protein
MLEACNRSTRPLARPVHVDHNDHMRRASLVQAKAHLSELVDEAEHKGKSVLILRHGKPAAAIVPIDLVPGARPAPAQPMSAKEARSLMARLVKDAPESAMSIEEALGRDRLDRRAR